MKKLLQIVLAVVSLIVIFAIISGGLVLLWRFAGDPKTSVKERIYDWIESVRNADYNWQNTYSIDETETLDLDGIRVIEIKAVSERVLISETAGQGTARLHGQYRALRQINWSVERMDDRLVIRTRFPRFGLFHGLTYNLEIPRSFEGSIEADTISGQIMLANDLSNKSSVTLSSVSGSLVAQSVSSDRIRLKTISGSIIATSLDSELVVFDTVSGSVFLDHVAAEVDGRTTSGSVQLNYDTFMDTRIESISGSIELAVPENASIDVSYSSVSGAFSNRDLKFEISEQSNRSFKGIMGSGEYSLVVETTSGSLLMKSR